MEFSWQLLDDDFQYCLIPWESESSDVREKKFFSWKLLTGVCPVVWVQEVEQEHACFDTSGDF